MAGRELKKLRRELSEAAMIYTIAGAGLTSLQAGQDRALAETDQAVRQAITNARNAGLDAEVDAMLAAAVDHRDFLGKNKAEWLAFLNRLDADRPAESQPSMATPEPAKHRREAPQSATANPEAPEGRPETRPQQQSESMKSANGSKWSGLLVIPILLFGMLVAGPWIVNKVITRSSADVGRCYDSLKAISGGQFDELDCNDPSAMRLFMTGTSDELRASSSCPNSSLTVIIDRPDTAYCLAPAYFGEAQTPTTRTTPAPTTGLTVAPSTTGRSGLPTTARDLGAASEVPSTLESSDLEQSTLRAPTELRCVYRDVIYGGSPQRAVSYIAEWTWIDRSEGEAGYILWSQAGRFELGPNADRATLASSEGNWTVMTSLEVVGLDGEVVTINAPSCEDAGGVLPPPPNAESTTTTVTSTTTAAKTTSPSPEELVLRLMEAANRSDGATVQALAPDVGTADLDRFLVGAPYVFEGCFGDSQPECSMFSDSLYVNVGTEQDPEARITYIGFFTG